MEGDGMNKVKVVVERLVQVRQFVGGGIVIRWCLDNKSPFVGSTVGEVMGKVNGWRSGVRGVRGVAYRTTMTLPCGSCVVV